MRKIILTLSFILTGLCFASAQQLRTPAPSPTQTLKQDFGLSYIELSYSRPGVKGRKIFGGLVPFDKLWRTGANAPTTITFGDEVTIGGTKIPAGKYGLLTIPGKDNWIVIITKQTNVSASAAAYKEENDVVRVNVKPMIMNNKLETFTMQIADIKPNSCELHLHWDNTMVIVPITTDVDSKVMAQIDEIMNKGDNKNLPYFTAAMYYLDNGKDLHKAAEWFDKSVEQTPGAYWAWYQRARCYVKLGKKQEAIDSAKKSIEAAKKAKNDDYVALNEKLLASIQ